MDGTEAADAPDRGSPSDALCVVVTYNSGRHILDCLRWVEGRLELVAAPVTPITRPPVA